MGITDVPAVEIEIGKQEYDERCRQNCLARGAPDLLGSRREREYLGPESEIDADIDQHRPAERRGGGEHDAALDDEQNGQKERQQSRNADDDAMVEGDAVDLVLVGLGLPQIELVELVRA